MMRRRIIMCKLPNLLQSRSTSSQDSILSVTLNNAGKIILNRPKVLNAIDSYKATKIVQQLKQWENNKSLVLMKSSDNKMFTAGGDIRNDIDRDVKNRINAGWMKWRQVSGTICDPRQEDDGDIRNGFSQELFKTGYQSMFYISKYKIPFVTLLNGFTFGSGLGMAVTGRYSIATENTVVAMPENRAGFCPDAGSTYFLPRLKSMVGFYLGLTGNTLKGHDAVTAGLVTHYVPSKYLNDLELKLSKCTNEEEINTTINEYSETSEGYSLEPYLKHIEFCFSAPTVERCTQTAEIIKRLSPGSLKVTLEAFKIGLHLNLEECLQMEYRLTCHAATQHDFPEGIRAILVDKDNNPKWNPASLPDVTDEYVQRFFMPLPENNKLIFDE